MTLHRAAPVREKKKPNHERWLVSYADLLTLLLALFIVLFASSSRDKIKLQQISQGMLAAFNGAPPAILITAASAGRGIMPHQVTAVARPTVTPAPRPSHAQPPQISRALQAEILALQNVQRKLMAVLQPLTAQNQVTMSSQPLTLTISFNASALFPTGTATVMPPAAALLEQVADGLKKLPDPFSIVIQGYTDDQPIATAQFPSNWDLSTARAVSVVELFVASGIGGNRLSAQGFGQYAPFVANTTDAQRAQNRRVVVVIHAPDPNAQ